MTTPTDPTPTDPHAAISFMAQLGQLEVKVEQAGVRLSNGLGEVIDHLSWDQVKHLLVPALRHHSPTVLEPPTKPDPEPAPEAETSDAGGTTPTADVQQLPDELRDLFSTWFQGELDGLRAEFGKELTTLHGRIDTLWDKAAQTTTATAAPRKAVASKTARKPAGTRAPAAPADNA